MNRRLATIFAVAVLTAAACSTAPAQTTAPPAPTGGSPTQAPATTAPPQPTNAGPKQGGTFVVTLPGDMSRTDPALALDNNAYTVMEQVMEGLVDTAPGSTSEIVPVLAESLPEVTNDGTTYTFTLRQGVTFHDGTPFNADAVKYNYDRWNNLPAELQDFAYYWRTVFAGFGTESNLASVDVLDPYTVAINLKQPNSSFLLATTLVVFAISSPAALQAGDADNIDNSQAAYSQGGDPAMVGTGPFIFDEWVPGDSVTVVKNADYWGTPAYLDRVAFKIIGEQTATLNAVQSGSVDGATIIAPQDAAVVEQDPSLQVITRAETCNVTMVGINHEFPVVSDVNIRKAMMYALDRQSYLDALWSGLGEVADNWMPPSTAYWKALDLPSYDPDRARTLIEQSGITGDDLKFTFTYPTGVTRAYLPDPKGLFEAIVRDLEAVGFQVETQALPFRPNYSDMQFTGQLQVFESGIQCDWAAPDSYITSFFGFSGGEPAPRFDYANEQMNQYMLDALAAPSDAEAARLWGLVQDELANDIPTIPLVHTSPPGAAQTYVMGWIGAGTAIESYKEVWLDK